LTASRLRSLVPAAKVIGVFSLPAINRDGQLEGIISRALLMQEKISMRSLPLAGAALVMFPVGAVGADAPNLVGSWTRTTHTMAVLKGSSKPLFTHAEDQVGS